ncbi:hypothetical protein PAPYR_13264 [Paratrimastix pyriformis]|uniref:Uncharacterized protein n=1 Tax=Paratrimastix pyriformis TaxID=342808 RepID=A0ABQ8U2W4_9EUKA|nr:hypothetical protein PAPYR_13264 [Paratrimastix pyriformis]
MEDEDKGVSFEVVLPKKPPGAKKKEGRGRQHLSLSHKSASFTRRAHLIALIGHFRSRCHLILRQRTRTLLRRFLWYSSRWSFPGFSPPFARWLPPNVDIARVTKTRRDSGRATRSQRKLI